MAISWESFGKVRPGTGSILESVVVAQGSIDIKPRLFPLADLPNARLRS